MVIFLIVTFSTHSVKTYGHTMSKFALLLSILPAAVLCECQLKDNAQDLLFVGYFSDGRTFTYVDMIEVKMKDASFRQFGRLLFQGECESMNAKLNVALYKRQEDKIKLVAKATRRYKGKVRFDALDPCASYEVNVTIGNLDVGLYKLGPYYSQEGVTYPLLASEDNPFYENNTQEIKRIQVMMIMWFALHVSKKKLSFSVLVEMRWKDCLNTWVGLKTVTPISRL